MTDPFDDPDVVTQIEDEDPESLAGDEAVYDPDAEDVDDAPPEVGDRWLDAAGGA